MEFVEEVFEISRRRLFEFFKPQKFADLFFAEWVHAAGF
jgi:hypothetical protein